MLPRFRIVAVSMQRLQIGRARIVVICIDMIYLDSVVMLEAQSTVATTPVFTTRHFPSTETYRLLCPTAKNGIKS